MQWKYNFNKSGKMSNVKKGLFVYLKKDIIVYLIPLLNRFKIMTSQFYFFKYQYNNCKITSFAAEGQGLWVLIYVYLKFCKWMHRFSKFFDTVCVQKM